MQKMKIKSQISMKINRETQNMIHKKYKNIMLIMEYKY